MVSPGEQRRAWAYAMISRCQTPPPAYGSLEWLALPDGSLEKVAAVILAAEKCAIDVEIEKRTEDRLWAAERAEHRASWSGRGFRPDPRIAADVEQEWRDWIGGAA